MAEKPDEEEYELASKLSKIKLKDEHEIPVKMLTWNTNFSKGESHTAHLRDTLIPVIQRVTRHCNCIVFFQEIKIGAASVTKKWGFSNVTLSSIDSGTKEAGLSSPTRELEKQTSFEEREWLDDTKLKELGVTNQDFIDRMCAQKITVKHRVGQSEYIAEITVISYHAKYRNESETARNANMVQYFKTMCNVADMLGQTIIIGGDFNLPILHWKDKVEKEFPNRVSVALYAATPRRWMCDKLIDTFVIVQPSDAKHQTKVTFRETMGIYPFPLAGYVGGDQPTTLQVYPSSKSQWFKYVHFNNADLKEIKDGLVKKGEDDLKAIPEKIKNKQDELLSKETKPEKKKELQNAIAKLEVKKEQLKDGAYLSESFGDMNLSGGPTPLWPNSCLHEVLDHDPVLTTIKITLKRNDSAEHIAPDTPVKRVTRSTK